MALIRYTARQLEIVRIIKEKRHDGEHCDVYDIMDKVYAPVARDALLHSIRVLVNNGLVERLPRVIRDGRSVRPFAVTSAGYALV